MFKVPKLYVDEYWFPRIVWSHWSDLLPPHDIQEMIEVTKKSLSNFTYCLLTPANISYFLDKGLFPSGYHRLHLAGKADYIRIDLLTKYGGIYVDSSTYVYSGVGVEWFISEALKKKSQFIAFEYNWSNMGVELSFIGSPGGSYFMKEFRKEMDSALTVGHKIYVNQTCKELKRRGIKFSKTKCKPYFVVDLVYETIVSKNSSMKGDVLVLPESLSNYGLRRECAYNNQSFPMRMLDDSSVKINYYFVKVTSNQRRLINKERVRRMT